jgi:tyrosinase
MVVNLGPVFLPLNNGSVLTRSGLEYNPRCLKRDVSAGVNSAYVNATSVVNLLTQNFNINEFQMSMQGIPGSGNIGVHGGGHYTIGGDPAGDVIVSPDEPVSTNYPQLFETRVLDKALPETWLTLVFF